MALRLHEHRVTRARLWRAALSVAAVTGLVGCHAGVRHMEAPGTHRRIIEVTAHRGAHEPFPLGAPENTLAAYQKAIDLGVDYVEIDARRTKDGSFVCVHNDNVDAYASGATGLVRDLTLAELEALDIGSRYHPSFAGTRIPSFTEVLNFVHGRDGAGVYLDVKDAAPDSVVAYLRRHDMLARTMVYDDPDALAAMRQIEPRIRAFPEYPGSPERVAALAERLHPDVIAISSVRRMTPEAVAACHAVGARAIVDIMAADNPEGWSRAIEYGVDGLQTDRPTELMRFLRERGLHD